MGEPINCTDVRLVCTRDGCGLKIDGQAMVQCQAADLRARLEQAKERISLMTSRFEGFHQQLIRADQAEARAKEFMRILVPYLDEEYNGLWRYEPERMEPVDLATLRPDELELFRVVRAALENPPSVGETNG